MSHFCYFGKGGSLRNCWKWCILTILGKGVAFRNCWKWTILGLFHQSVLKMSSFDHFDQHCIQCSVTIQLFCYFSVRYIFRPILPGNSRIRILPDQDTNSNSFCVAPASYVCASWSFLRCLTLQTNKQTNTNPSGFVISCPSSLPLGSKQGEGSNWPDHLSPKLPTTLAKHFIAKSQPKLQTGQRPYCNSPITLRLEFWFTSFGTAQRLELPSEIEQNSFTVLRVLSSTIPCNQCPTASYPPRLHRKRYSM